MAEIQEKIKVRLRDPRAKLKLQGVTLEGPAPNIVFNGPKVKDAISKGFLILVEKLETKEASKPSAKATPKKDTAKPAKK